MIVLSEHNTSVIDYIHVEYLLQWLVLIEKFDGSLCISRPLVSFRT